MNRIESLSDGNIPSYLLPLLWHGGESPDRMGEEITQMHTNGVGGFIVESRLHPDFLGERWWQDLEFILAEAQKRNMKVWVFDDSRFPSGFGGGRIRDQFPEYSKTYLREQHVNETGPRQRACYPAKLDSEALEKLIKVIVARRTDDADGIDVTSLLDVTSEVNNDILCWNVPEGKWRIFFFIQTRKGGEPDTREYLNPLMPEAVQAFIDIVYEAHYEHFSKYFGNTFAGFFSDEPRFGNSPSYKAVLGNSEMVLPYCDTLLKCLRDEWGSDFAPMLPCLWYGADNIAAARYTYMNLVSNLYAHNFAQQIGDWCRNHGVEWIGHVIEDNGAHARLGYGNGHFFRAIRGQDYSGFDIVYNQVRPGNTSGVQASPLGDLDNEFFYWGLAKLASSESHIDPKKRGRTACELLGAFGWQAGLMLMKWLTDHICVRGTNFIIPHAFSPKDFPDPDAPPHFYARGENPQWRYFKIWSGYTNRVCHLLSNGRHFASVAVVYHAEAEWSGDYEPFERVVKALAQKQIDCDIVPIDTFLDDSVIRIDEKHLRINQENYHAIVIPYSEYITESFCLKLLDLAKTIPIIFMKDYPQKILQNKMSIAHLLDKLKVAPRIFVLDYDDLANKLISWDFHDVEVTDNEPELRCYHYLSLGTDIYFLTNESTKKSICTTLVFRHTESPLGFDALENAFYQPCWQIAGGRAHLKINLEPFESTFLIFSDVDGQIKTNVARKPDLDQFVPLNCINGEWHISTSTARDYPSFSPEPKLVGLGNAAEILPKFSGTIRYGIQFDLPENARGHHIFLDLHDVYEIADVTINGQHAGTRICPPYRVDISNFVKIHSNSLVIDVTNTLAKQCGDNVFDRAIPQEPTGLIGPVEVLVQKSQV